MKTKKINYPEVIKKFDQVLARGLCAGVGDPDEQVCVEAAIAIAMGLTFNDKPECVSPAVWTYKISLNDAGWSSPQARAAGLRNLGIAQIGFNGIDGAEFSKRISPQGVGDQQ